MAERPAVCKVTWIPLQRPHVLNLSSVSCIHPYGHMGGFIFHVSLFSFTNTHTHWLPTFFPDLATESLSQAVCQLFVRPLPLFSSSVPCSVRPNYCLMNQGLFTSSWGHVPPLPRLKMPMLILVQSAMHHHLLVNLKHLNYHITLHCSCFPTIGFFFLTLRWISTLLTWSPHITSIPQLSYITLGPQPNLRGHVTIWTLTRRDVGLWVPHVRRN